MLSVASAPLAFTLTNATACRHTYWHVDTFQLTYIVQCNTVSSIFLTSTEKIASITLAKPIMVYYFVFNYSVKNFTVLISSYLQWSHCLSRRSACWYCRFESRHGHGYFYVVNVVCFQVQVSASGWSLVQGRSTECSVSEGDRGSSITRRPWPTAGCCLTVKQVSSYPLFSI